MLLPKLNLILSILLLVGLCTLFIQFLSFSGKVTLAERRVTELEKRPLVQSTQQQSVFDSQAEPLVQVVSQTISPSPSATPAPGAPKLAATPTHAPEKKFTYLPIYGGGFQTTQTTWVDVPGSEFQLNISDYGARAYATFEATAWVIGGSGHVKLRIFDTTHSITVDGSTIAGSFASPALIVSGKLNFFSGQNTYRVQVSSETSSTVEFDFGRIKLQY